MSDLPIAQNVTRIGRFEDRLENMGILTEAALRILLKDEDLDAMREYSVDGGTIVTPSAKSFLMDHKISLVCGDRYKIKAPQPERGDDKTDKKVAASASQRVRQNSALDAPLKLKSFEKKPEHMCSLRGDDLVFKDHKTIKLRGKIDSLEARILETQLAFIRHGLKLVADDLGEVLDFVRGLMRAEVLEETAPTLFLFGMDEKEIRARSHHPQDYYGLPHFMPITVDDGEAVLMLNVLRTMSREVEIAGFEAFADENHNVVAHEDILLAMNRLSSIFYVLMLRVKAKEYERGADNG